LLPGIDSRYYVTGWAPDGSSVYVGESHSHERAVKIFRANVTTGKMDVWKTFGDSLPTGANAGNMLFSIDGSAYVYLYVQVLSQAYVVKGLK
jgi:Tol biopolymer transport system component